MVATMPDQKRMAIAQKLASMREVQNLIISNEQKLLQECNDSDIKERLQKMLEDDRKNLGIIETCITQYGIQAEPRETVTQMVEQAKKLMESSDLSVYEKASQHELIKHQQVMSGLLVHKAGQVVGADIEAAIAPLNTVNFENRAHQEQLKGILEVLGTRELTGQEPDQSVWGRVQDALSAFTGVVGSAVTQSSDKSDMNIQDVLRLDHQKVNTLFAEIGSANDTQKAQEFFTQLAMDLTVHAQAEEEVVYPKLRPYYDKTEELYQEQAEMKQKIEQIQSVGPSSSDFKDRVMELQRMVMDHVRQEESELFAAIRNNCSTEQQEQIATEFKEAKKQFQTQMLNR